MNPLYTLKHDRKRTFIYSNDSFPEFENSIPRTKNWSKMIHPVQAMVLSFFSNGKILSEVVCELSVFLEKSEEDVLNIITPYLNNKESVYTEYNGITYPFPSNVLIEKPEFEINSRRYNVNDFIYTELDFEEKRFFENPSSITLMVNNRCVTNCVYCYADVRNRQDCSIPFDKIKDLIKQAYDSKVSNFGVIAGEVLLYKNWYELLLEMKKYYFYPNLISTKIPLKEDAIIKLKRILTNKTKIQISLDSTDADDLTKILKVNSNYFNEIKIMFDLFKEHSVKVNIATVLTKYNSNVESIKGIISFLNSYSDIIENWSIRPATDSLYIDYEYFKTIKTNYIDVDKIHKYLEPIISDLDYEVALEKDFLNKEYYNIKTGSVDFKGATCSANRSHMFILPDGNVTICEQLYWKPNFIIGNIINNSITEVWNSQKSLFFANIDKSNIRELSKCHSCSILEECFSNKNRCWADILKAYGDENWDYPDPRCAMAPKMTVDLSFVKE